MSRWAWIALPYAWLMLWFYTRFCQCDSGSSKLGSTRRCVLFPTHLLQSPDIGKLLYPAHCSCLIVKSHCILWPVVAIETVIIHFLLPWLLWPDILRRQNAPPYYGNLSLTRCLAYDNQRAGRNNNGERSEHKQPSALRSPGVSFFFLFLFDFLLWKVHFLQAIG